jgi:hypothetical protein
LHIYYQYFNRWILINLARRDKKLVRKLKT